MTFFPTSIGSMSIHITVDKGNNGSNEFRTTVSLKSTIADLEKILINEDSSNIKGVRLIFFGKPLDVKTKTLEDAGFYDGCTIYAAYKMHYGTSAAYVEHTEGGCHILDPKKVRKCGGTVVTSNCMIGGSEGCHNSDLQKCKLKCGCIFCPDCMRYLLKMCVYNGTDSPHSRQIRCGTSSSKHAVDIPIELAFAIAGYKGGPEFDRIQRDLSKPWMRKFLKSCPHCKVNVFRDGEMNRVNCAMCKNADWCWHCSRTWRGHGTAKCGNICSHGLRPDVMAQLMTCGTKTIGSVKNVPKKRICPGPNCLAVNEHSSGCGHMRCPSCKHQYCHVCLRKWFTPSNACPNGNCSVVANPTS